MNIDGISARTDVGLCHFSIDLDNFLYIFLVFSVHVVS
jgi:hypothetical protein